MLHRALHGYIIGRQGERIREIQADTSTKIKIPKLDQNLNHVTISGSTRNAIIECKKRIEMILSPLKDFFDEDESTLKVKNGQFLLTIEAPR